jgi:hypothetical protein
LINDEIQYEGAYTDNIRESIFLAGKCPLGLESFECPNHPRWSISRGQKAPACDREFGLTKKKQQKKKYKKERKGRFLIAIE